MKFDDHGGSRIGPDYYCLSVESWTKARQFTAILILAVYASLGIFQQLVMVPSLGRMGGTSQWKNPAASGVVVCSHRPTTTTTSGGIASNTTAEDDFRLLENHPLLENNYGQLYHYVAQQRDRMEQDIQDSGYGRYFHDIFYAAEDRGDTNDTNATMLKSLGRLAFHDPDQPQGWQSLVRRLQIKILTAQEDLLQTREDAAKGEYRKCYDLASGGKADDARFPVKFVYAVAGHSSSAGHGNFEKESYASVMEKSIGKLFQSLGIELETRNYGMSGMASLPEMALCQEAILGTDVDLLTWDFAQTDNRNCWHFSFWMQRASLMRNHPILMANQVDARYKSAIDDLHENHPHLPVLVRKESVMEQLKASIPDTLEVSNLPPLLRYLKCGSPFLERNDPCAANTFKPTICPDRRWMVSWHPGYKQLALLGNLLALFLADALQEAIQDLEDLDVAASLPSLRRTKERLNQLKAEEEVQRNRVLATDYQPIPGVNSGKRAINTTQLFPGINASWLYQSASLCRTPRLPSQQRYKGITGHAFLPEKVRVPEEGLERQIIVAALVGNSTMNATIDDRLDSNNIPELSIGWHDEARSSQRKCNLTTNLDFPDYFYVTDQWRKATLPSKKEMDEYRPDQQRPILHGIIIVCFVDCKQTRSCQDGEEPFGNWTRVDFKVNGVQAQASSDFFRKDCNMLSRKSDNSFLFPPLANGTYYDFRVRIKPNIGDEGMVLPLSSIVLL